MRISELENILRKHAETTKTLMQTPLELNKEIMKMEVNTMSKSKGGITMKRTLAIVAVLALCIVTVTVTPLANPIKGFFSDIIRFDGAIIGTRYENATSEIIVKAMEIKTDNGNDIIPLEITFENPNDAPFAYIQEIAVADYMILDEETGEILKLECYPEYSGKGTIKGGKTVINLPISDEKLTSDEEYTIVIDRMYGLAKADAPLDILGNWKCKFVK